MIGRRSLAIISISCLFGLSVCSGYRSAAPPKLNDAIDVLIEKWLDSIVRQEEKHGHGTRLFRDSIVQLREDILGAVYSELDERIEEGTSTGFGQVTPNDFEKGGDEVYEANSKHTTGNGAGNGSQDMQSVLSEGFSADVELHGRVLSDCACADADEGDFVHLKGFWPNFACIILCLCCAAMAAGLTTGLVSIEPLEMAVKLRSGTAEEKKHAARILPLVEQHHFLLVSLLLFNSMASEALPIFLDNLLPAYQAVLASVTLVLFFGEILPSAIFTGPNQMKIASHLTLFVWCLMAVMSPVAWPIAKLLDILLGNEGYKRYTRADITALIEVQQELCRRDSHDLTEEPLQDDEVAMVTAMLKVSEKSVADIMVSMEQVYCLSIDAVLDVDTMADIIASGYSRVLIYDGTRDNIRGFLQVKRLIVVSPSDNRPVRTLILSIPEVVSPEDSVLRTLDRLREGHAHVALVSTEPEMVHEALRNGQRLPSDAAPLGIITLEDCLEAIIQREIYDESDRLARYITDRAKATLLRFTKLRATRRTIGLLPAVGNAVHSSSTMNLSAIDQASKILGRSLSRELVYNQLGGSVERMERIGSRTRLNSSNHKPSLSNPNSLNSGYGGITPREVEVGSPTYSDIGEQYWPVSPGKHHHQKGTRSRAESANRDNVNSSLLPR